MMTTINSLNIYIGKILYLTRRIYIKDKYENNSILENTLKKLKQKNDDGTMIKLDSSYNFPYNG